MTTQSPQKENRRMELLKKMGLFGPKNNNISFVRVTTCQDLRQAYRMVHDVFVKSGYIHPRPSSLRLRIFEALPETATFIAKIDEQVIGVESIVIDSPNWGLPSDSAFKRELDILRRQGKIIGEITNEAIQIDYRKGPVGTELMRCLLAHAMFVGCTDVIASVSPGHVQFICDVLGFSKVNNIPKNYSDEVYDPVVLVRLSIESFNERFLNVVSMDGTNEGFLKEYFLEGNPYHEYVKSVSTIAENIFDNSNSLQSLFPEPIDIDSIIAWTIVRTMLFMTKMEKQNDM